MSKLVKFSLVKLRLRRFDAAKYPIKKSADGVPYVDIPATGFYEGQHKGFPYSAEHIAQLEESFEKPTEELYGSVPLMVDHSFSNKDKVGHLRSVKTEDIEGLAHSSIVCRIVGKSAIQGVQEGKYRTLSAGILHELDDSEDEEAGMDAAEDEPEEELAAEDESEDHADEDDPEEVEEEEEEEDSEDHADEDEAPGDSYSALKRINSRSPGVFTYSEAAGIRVRYDHMAFTPFPALTQCKLHKRSEKPMPTPTKKPVEHSRAKELAEVRNHAQQLQEELEQERAEREADKRATAKKFASIQTENYIKAGKVTPAQKKFFQGFYGLLDDEQRDLFDKYMELAPVVIHYGIQGEVLLTPPEFQEPLKRRSAVGLQAQVSQVVSKFKRSAPVAPATVEAGK